MDSFPLLSDIAGILLFVSSTVNPILYNLMSVRYRTAFKQVSFGQFIKSDWLIIYLSVYIYFNVCPCDTERLSKRYRFDNLCKVIDSLSIYMYNIYIYFNEWLSNRYRLENLCKVIDSLSIYIYITFNVFKYCIKCVRNMR